jgi:hypothetical protein
MNSLNKYCKSIDKKIDFLINKVTELEETILQLTPSDKKSVEQSTEKKVFKKNVKKISLISKPSIEKTGSITIKEYDDCILIKGDTYDKKAVIKNCKGKWNPDNKGWVIKNKSNKEKLIRTLKKISKIVTNERVQGELFDLDSPQHTDHQEETNNILPGFAFLDDS